VPSTLHLLDLATLVEEDAEELPTDSKLGVNFLHHMSKVDGYMQVFSSKSDISQQIQMIKDEMILRDLQVIEKKAAAPSLSAEYVTKKGGKSAEQI